VYPVSDEGGLDTAKHGVCYNTDWKQETSSYGVHASEILDDGTTTGQQHSCNQDVSHKTKDDEYAMGDSSIAGTDGFQEGMSVGGFAFEFNSQGCEENDLYGSARGIPERSGNTVVVSYSR
jgi:hypothetical protein